MMQEWLLLSLVLVPLISAVVCFALTDVLAKYFAFGVSLVGLVLGAVLYCTFDGSHATQFQLPISFSWITSLGVQFAFAIDGLSFPLVVLTKVMMPVAVLASFPEKRNLKLYMACYLFLDAAMTGTFLATDLVLFYVFWEMMLIPMLLLIGIWGSEQRIYASLKFFIFTFAGSVLMLVAIFFLITQYHEQFGTYSTNIASLYQLHFTPVKLCCGLSIEQLIFLAFFIAFAIKVPLFPLHTWLPDAHVQAPTGGSILLAAVLLKMGTYGMLRFAIPIAPNAFVGFAPCIAHLSIIGILYGAWVAFKQKDMKKMVAYSSVSHLGFCVLGICAMNAKGLTGSMLQMVNHGLSTGALFLLVGMLYERRHSKKFADYGGLASILPFFSLFFVFVACSSMGVPGLNGFVGEFLVLMGSFEANPVWAGISVLGVVFGALYMLSMVKQVLFGPVTHTENRSLKDLSPREWLVLVPLCLLILYLGIAPHDFLLKFNQSIDGYWAQVLKKTALDASLMKGGNWVSL